MRKVVAGMGAGMAVVCTVGMAGMAHHMRRQLAMVAGIPRRAASHRVNPLGGRGAAVMATP